MKKLMLMALIVVALGITSCGNDDDGNPGCQSCGEGAISIELCDNGDGTYSVNGENAGDIPEGFTFQELVDQSCAAINILN